MMNRDVPSPDSYKYQRPLETILYMPENLFIQIPSDKLMHVTQMALSTEAVTDTTLPAKNTKSEKRKEMSFNLFPHLPSTLHLHLTEFLKMQAVDTKPAFGHLHYRKEEK